MMKHWAAVLGKRRVWDVAGAQCRRGEKGPVHECGFQEASETCCHVTACLSSAHSVRVPSEGFHVVCVPWRVGTRLEPSLCPSCQRRAARALGLAGVY